LAVERVREIRGTGLPVRGDDIDTDRIIPARFLKSVSFEGLEAHLFEDDRQQFDAAGTGIHPASNPAYRSAAVMLVGGNFGCGSSREHAVWALHDHGIRAVVSTSLADIFRRNALKNGLLAVVVEPEAHAKLLAAPGAEVTVDLESATVSLPDGGRAAFPIEPFSRYCLLEGIDELQFLLAQGEAIASHESAHGY
jgi:3-isopropylmalate/(R)-2-methylmalate dehydratase small subunit